MSKHRMYADFFPDDPVLVTRTGEIGMVGSIEFIRTVDESGRMIGVYPIYHVFSRSKLDQRLLGVFERQDLLSEEEQALVERASERAAIEVEALRKIVDPGTT